MDFWMFIIAIVAISHGSAIAREWIKRNRPVKGQDELVKEIKALRGEIQELRQHNNNAILSFDATLDRVERRLDRLDSQSLPGSSVSSAEAGVGVGTRYRS